MANFGLIRLIASRSLLHVRGGLNPDKPLIPYREYRDSVVTRILESMSKRRPEGPVTLTPTREHVKSKRRGGRGDADALEETGRTEKSSSVGASTTDTGRRAPRRQISGGDLGGLSPQRGQRIICDPLRLPGLEDYLSY